MKSLKKPKLFSTVIVLLLLMHNTLLPQENAHGSLNDSLPKEVRAYMDFLSGFESYDSYGKLLFAIENMPMVQLKHAAKILYEAYEANALEAIKQHNLLLYTTGKMGNNSSRRFRYPKEGYDRLFGRITEQLKTALPFVSSAYLFKASVKSVKEVKYFSRAAPDSSISCTKIDVTVVIDEIFKGNTHYKVGDEVMFYYLPHWEEAANLNFSVGDKIFLPLTLTSFCHNFDCEFDVLVLLFGPNNFGEFQIINNKIIDRGNSFGYGTEVPWEKFRSKIIQQINEIKSW